MQCPECASFQTKINRTLKIPGKVIRQHVCEKCGCRYESVARVSAVVESGNSHICNGEIKIDCLPV